MARFKFLAIDAQKQEVKGFLEAQDRQSALDNLSGKYELVLEVQEEKLTQGLWARGVSAEEVMVVTQQLAVMLKSGMTLRHALNLVDAESPTLEHILAEVSAGVGEGKSLSDTLEKHPRVFSRLYTSMVRAGEAAGRLPLILTKLAEYLESAEELKRKVKGALTYPVVVIGISMAMAVFIFLFGVNQFRDIYAGLNAELPASTRVVLGIADFLESWWLPLLIALVAVFFGVRRFLSSGPGETFRDRMLLTMPIFGPLMQRLAIARFARTLSTLQASGVPILTSLDLVASSLGNRIMERVVRQSVKNVQEGQSLVVALRESRVFTRMALSMIATGEESGTLDTMLEEVAGFYEVQVETMLKSLVSLLEPITIVGVGVFVALIIIALGLPMMNLVQHLG